MKKHLLYMGIACSAMLAAVSCNQDDDIRSIDPLAEGKSEITIHPYIGVQTRLDNKNDRKWFDARYEFEQGDDFMLTYIGRTEIPVSGFIYYDRSYYCNEYQGWNPRFTHKLYWTDSKKHTFIGYSVPKREGGFTFAPKDDDEKWQEKGTTDAPIWNSAKNGQLSYYGTLSTDQTDSLKYKGEDLLLTYSKDIQADLTGENVAAQLKMHHAFAKVRIVLNINGFAWDKDATEDITTQITSLGLSDQPLDFVWDQKSYNVEVVEGAESDNVINAWKATEEGTANEKTFTAFALVLPGTRDVVAQMELQYSDVTQPKEANGKYPLKTVYYNAKFTDVVFTGGERTTLSVTLTHLNEPMIVKATYSHWEEVDLDDRTNLQTKSVYLKSLDDKDIKLGADEGNTNIEKCSWLYTYDEKDGQKTIHDCYGNDGTEAKPYLIKYADELLAFKKEVENGRTFEDQYVKLFTDIYLQSKNDAYALDWKSIGDDTHSFAGTFEGNYSAIQSLIGEPLFKNLPSTACIQHLTVQTFDARKKVPTDDDGNVKKAEVYATGGAILCNTNNGLIMGCTINGTAANAAGNAAGIALNNKGTIYASYHQGDVKGSTGAAGLVYENSGIIKACYQAGEVSGNATTSGVVASNNNETTGAISYCYYDTFLAPGMKAVGSSEDTENVKGENIDKLKVLGFEKTLNDAITEINGGLASDAKKIDVHYIQTPGDYPTLEPEKISVKD